MDKKKISLILLSIALLSSIFLFGCKVEKIQFNRESQAQAFVNKLNNKSNTQIKKSSGMIILKDESSNNVNIKFGPSEVNFDLPVKF